MPSLSVSTTSRRRANASMASPPVRSSVSATDAQLTACDVISVRFRRRSRSSRYNNYSAKGMTSSCPSPKPLMLLFVALASFFFANKVAPVHSLSAAKNTWINNSIQYYNRITRGAEHVQQSPTYLKSAMENYFALEKLRENKSHHAETIYRRLMDEFNPRNIRNMNGCSEVDQCNFSHLAVPTLLLGLLLQREERFDDARTVFEGFSHVLDAEGADHECCCTARVLQAHALFEMKQENPTKAVELILRAVRMDHNLRPVLRWKQFRDAMAEYKMTRQQQPQAMLLTM